MHLLFLWFLVQFEKFSLLQQLFKSLLLIDSEQLDLLKSSQDQVLLNWQLILIAFQILARFGQSLMLKQLHQQLYLPKLSQLMPQFRFKQPFIFESPDLRLSLPHRPFLKLLFRLKLFQKFQQPHQLLQRSSITYFMPQFTTGLLTLLIIQLLYFSQPPQPFIQLHLLSFPILLPPQSTCQLVRVILWSIEQIRPKRPSQWLPD